MAEPVIVSVAAPRSRTGGWSVNYWTWSPSIGNLVVGTESLVAALKPTFIRVGGYNNDANVPDAFDDAQLDAMVAYARAIGAQPILQVPLLADTQGQPPTAATAAAMVTYANLTKGYGIKYFSIGNEPDLYPSQGLPWAPAQPARPDYTPADYCADVSAFVTAMKAVDGSIKIVGPDLSWKYQSGANDWLTPILQQCGEYFDFVAVHRYPFSSAQATLANAAADAKSFRAIVASLRDHMLAAGYGGKPLAITEMNIAYDATTTVLAASPGTVPSGLWLADVLGSAIDLGLWTAAVWDISDDDHWSLGILGLPPAHAPRPEYYAYALYADHYGSTLVDVTSAPAGVSAYATRNQAASATEIIVINWNRAPAPLAFEVTGLPTTPARAIYVLPALSMAAVEIPDDGTASAWIYGEAQHGAGAGLQPLASGAAGNPPSAGGDAAADVRSSTDGRAASASVSCDGGIPTADGGLSVSENYVRVGSLHGYATAWTWVGSDSSAIACSTPTCTAPGSLQVTAILLEGVAPLTSEAVSCSPAFETSALCTAGTVTADPTYESVAGLGFNLNQDAASDAGSLNTIAIGQSITVTAQKSGDSAGNAALRVQLTDSNNHFYCIDTRWWTSGTAIPIAKFNTKCWDNTGSYATSGMLFRRVDVLVGSNAYVDRPFAYCLTDVSVE